MKRDKNPDFQTLAQELADENRTLKARLLAFEKRRSASEFPLDSNRWQYDGERFVLAPHPTPAYPGERLVICEMNGPPEAREKNASLICQARSAIFWCAAHELAAQSLGEQVTKREDKIALQFLIISELLRRMRDLPPDLLTVLESLLEHIGFHFQPNHRTTQLVREVEDVISRIKALST